MKRRAVVALAVALLALVASRRGAGEPPPPRHAVPWALAASADGARCYAACGPVGRVAVIDVAGGRVERFVETGGTPRGLAASADGKTLAVSLGPERAVVLVDLPSGAVRARVDVGAEPEGLQFDRTGAWLLVALPVARAAARVDAVRAVVTERVALGGEPFAVARAPGTGRLAVVSRRAEPGPPEEEPRGRIDLFDASGALERTVEIPSCHMAEAAAFDAEGRRLLVPFLRVRNLLPIVSVARGWVMSAVLAMVDADGSVRLAPLASPSRGFADPTGIAVAPDGNRAFVAASGTDEVAVIDLREAVRLAQTPDEPERMDRAATIVAVRHATGDDPRGLAVVRRGGRALVAVSERLDDTVALLDADRGVVSRVAVGPRVPEDPVHAGERVFADASYCFQGAFSCRSCHPEAGTDGLTYDFEVDGVGREVVLNRSLEGLEGTAPFKWKGTNPTVERQCGVRFAMVLTRADPIPEAKLHDLATYLLSLPPPRPLLDLARADPETRARVARGQAIFERSRHDDGTRIGPGRRCVTCHAPPHYTNRQTTDVGTRGPTDPDGRFDVPHLEGIGRKAPYLHDGRATTLGAIFADRDGRHGDVSDLDDEELADLVLYLETL